jgi:hypothetical protein
MRPVPQQIWTTRLLFMCGPASGPEDSARDRRHPCTPRRRWGQARRDRGERRDTHFFHAEGLKKCVSSGSSLPRGGVAAIRQQLSDPTSRLGATQRRVGYQMVKGLEAFGAVANAQHRRGEYGLVGSLDSLSEPQNVERVVEGRIPLAETRVVVCLEAEQIHEKLGFERNLGCELELVGRGCGKPKVRSRKGVP